MSVPEKTDPSELLVFTPERLTQQLQHLIEQQAPAVAFSAFANSPTQLSMVLQSGECYTLTVEQVF